MAFHRSFFGLFARNSDTVKKVEWIFPFSIHFAYFARLLSCWTAPHCKRLCVCVCADCAPSPLHSTIAIRCLCVFSILSDCCLHNKLDEFQFFFPSFSSSLTSCLTDLINFLKGFHFFAVFCFLAWPALWRLCASQWQKSLESHGCVSIYHGTRRPNPSGPTMRDGYIHRKQQLLHTLLLLLLYYTSE